MLMAIRQTQDIRRGRHAWAKASLLALALFVLSLSEAAFAGANEWTLRGFEHDEINALTIDPKNPSTLYVASKKGVFKSTDRGETWRSTTAWGPTSGVPPGDPLA